MKRLAGVQFFHFHGTVHDAFNIYINYVDRWFQSAWFIFVVCHPGVSNKNIYCLKMLQCFSNRLSTPCRVDKSTGNPVKLACAISHCSPGNTLPVRSRLCPEAASNSLIPEEAPVITTQLSFSFINPLLLADAVPGRFISEHILLARNKVSSI